MGKIREPIPMKLFVGMLSAEASLFEACDNILRKEYGSVDFRSEIQPWNRTDYYQEELGTDILRTFIFFEQLMDPAILPMVKIFTNALEKQFATGSGSGTKRRINLDPGYITEAKIVLASTKDFSHRIYVGQNIFAEVTLQYRLQGRTFISLEHTYPDFRSDESIALFNKARRLLQETLRTQRHG